MTAGALPAWSATSSAAARAAAATEAAARSVTAYVEGSACVRAAPSENETEETSAASPPSADQMASSIAMDIGSQGDGARDVQRQKRVAERLDRILHDGERVG